MKEEVFLRKKEVAALKIELLQVTDEEQEATFARVEKLENLVDKVKLEV